MNPNGLIHASMKRRLVLRASLSSACLMIILLIPQQRMLSGEVVSPNRFVKLQLSSGCSRPRQAWLDLGFACWALEELACPDHYFFLGSRVGEDASQLVRGHVSQVPVRPQNFFAQFRRQRVVTFPAAPVVEFTAGAGDFFQLFPKMFRSCSSSGSSLVSAGC